MIFGNIIIGPAIPGLAERQMGRGNRVPNHITKF
jgi:hypothetical protein